MIFLEKTNDKDLTLSLKGNFDEHTSPIIEEKLGEVISRDSVDNCYLDLSAVRYISSAGIRSLIIAYKKATKNNKRILIDSISEKSKDILKTVGILDLFREVA